MASLLLVLYINHIRFCSSWTSSTTRGAVIWLPYNVLAVHAPDNLVAVAHKPPFACWACSLQMKPDTSVTRNSQYVRCISTSSWLQQKDMKIEDWRVATWQMRERDHRWWDGHFNHKRKTTQQAQTKSELWSSRLSNSMQHIKWLIILNNSHSTSTAYLMPAKPGTRFKYQYIQRYDKTLAQLVVSRKFSMQSANKNARWLENDFQDFFRSM